MLLLELPLELLLEIWDALEGVKEMNAVVRACRYTYDNLNNRLYQFAAQEECSWKTLQWAAAKGPESTTRKLLDAGIDPKQSGNSALTDATEKGRLSIVNMLLKHGFDPNETDGFGRTPLHQASSDGNVEIARTLLDAGADLKAEDFDGISAFEWAVRSGIAEVLSLLIERGVSGNDPIHGGDTALRLAAERGHVDAAQTLLNAGADLQATDARGENALHRAAMGGHASAVVTLLLDRGAAPDIRDRRGRSALHWACSSRRPRKAVVELLLSKNVEVNARTEDTGGTPLSIAATLGFEEAIGPLLENGADPRLTDNEGCTSLALAARYGHAATVLALLDNERQKAEWHIDTPENLQRTPLFLATLYGHEHIVRILLSRGSNAIETPTSAGRTPLSFVHDYNGSGQKMFRMWMYLSGYSDTTLDPEGIEEASREAKDAIEDMWCNRCGFGISPYDIHFHCLICHSGDYDVCLECVTAGQTCLDVSHTLEKKDAVSSGWRLLE